MVAPLTPFVASCVIQKGFPAVKALNKYQSFDLGASVKEGEILAQVESVKTLISVVAPRSGKVTGVKEQSHGVPQFEITPWKPSESDFAVDDKPVTTVTQPKSSSNESSSQK
jgi:hypothetical protein